MPEGGGSGRGDAAGDRTRPIHVAKAEFFRVLGHPARVRILELLREGEHSVGELQVALGLDSSGTSQHLGVLRRQGVLESRREGTSVYYRVSDPRMFDLLEVARGILTTSLEATQALLAEMATGPEQEPRTTRAPRRRGAT
ncbi:ArsR/SmtB family transcription factor [Miltoncostaea oceani]|uniref:ArsR/SmtB family transcription factor n=1 Tax=Miltoncostaea oceani TaxID=2843216 RepID=UPI001C3CE59E|nr:metalloregulator ArsR/SmtB family transcription factor [Miltoncostaea oceani]